MQTKIFLICNGCVKKENKKHANYITSKTKQDKEKKIILKKYCKFCRLTQEHREEIIKSSKGKK